MGMDERKLKRSNAAHDRLRWRHAPLHRKHNYHLRCIQRQNLEGRVRSKKERKKIWDDTSVAPW